MITTEITALNHTLTETNEWLDRLVAIGPFENHEQAYSHLRAVLHALSEEQLTEAAQAVLQLLDERVEEGQVRHVRTQLPEQIEALWPS